MLNIQCFEFYLQGTITDALPINIEMSYNYTGLIKVAIETRRMAPLNERDFRNTNYGVNYMIT